MLTATPQATQLRAKLFRGLADPSRLSILEALCGGPRSVSELVEVTGLAQSNVSNHLGCLRDCGLVTSEQLGRYVYYQVSDTRVTDLVRLAGEVLSDVAQGVYACTRYQGEGSEA
jgi:ArsR family transcriptional regulator, cadmium/lead-responsive transcriptional repressor